MDGSAQLGVLRERIRLIVSTTAAIAIATFLVLNFLPKQYEAEARLLVGNIVGAQDPTLDDLLLAKQLASTYAVIATTRPIAEKVIGDLKLDTTPDKLLAQQVSAASGLDTPYITISARAGTPAQAAEIANAFAAEVERLARAQGTTGGVAEPSLIKVVEPAVSPLEPSAPRIVLFTLLSVIAGGALGLVLAFAREFLSPRVRSAAAVNALTGLRTLAVVPGHRDLRKSKDRWSELRAEFIALRTNLIAVASDPEPKKILVTSLRLGDGVSTVASGLAVAYAAAGSRVIVLDRASARRSAGTFTTVAAVPTTEPPAPTAGATDPDLMATRNPRIHVLQRGMVWPETGTLFERVDVTAALDQIGQGADVVIVDGPPVLGGIEAVSLGASVDLAVLVVDLSNAHRRDLELAATSLVGGGVEVAGIVANRPFASPWGEGAESESPYTPAIDRLGSELRTATPPRKRAEGRR